MPRTEPQGSSAKGGNSIIYVLAAVAVILGVVLAYVLIRNSKLVKELNIEKEELTEQIVALQADYAQISSDYESINHQLDSSREEVNQLVERIQKTEATNRAQIRKYQKELGTLRSIMRNYVHQIDSLNTLNHKLTGAVVRARDIKSQAFNNNGKVVDRANSTARILTNLTLSANDLAEKGPIRIYIVIKDPEGNLLTNEESRVCNYAGSSLETSASREVDYQGNELQVSIYMNDVPKYVKGIYTVQVLTERTLLGTTQFMLR